MRLFNGFTCHECARIYPKTRNSSKNTKYMVKCIIWMFIQKYRSYQLKRSRIWMAFTYFDEDKHLFMLFVPLIKRFIWEIHQHNFLFALFGDKYLPTTTFDAQILAPPPVPRNHIVIIFKSLDPPSPLYQ